ncbi:MAG TPA: RNA-binding cell elongation regulator Jag/EloR, partial [Mycobacteriales bacterium]|jgi:spoIIIJ-associated protein|nr:RNA-binding cell elongation regulator Jag/EloR [Mycobacteriales bacterium]
VRADPALVAEAAVEVVRELILRVGLDAQATVRSAGNPVVIDVMGEDLGLLIGRHGDTLGAFQYLVNSIVGKRVHRWCKVVIDVEHYRLRREDTLRTLANRQAARVRQTHQELVMEPMPAAERRIIHLTLQNSPYVVTHSKGEEPNRSVVIGLRPAER